MSKCDLESFSVYTLMDAPLASDYELAQANWQMVTLGAAYLYNSFRSFCCGLPGKGIVVSKYSGL